MQANAESVESIPVGIWAQTSQACGQTHPSNISESLFDSEF